MSGIRAEEDQFHSSVRGYLIFPMPFTEKSEKSLVDSLVRYELTVCICVGLFLGLQFCFIGPCVCFYASTILF